MFLHPNNTIKFLPLDNGVILTVKVYYHSLVAKRKFKFIDTGKEVKNLSILDAIYTLGNSCDVVSSSTVVNCFRKAVVLRKKKQKKQTASIEVMDDPFKLFVKKLEGLKSRGVAEKNFDMDDYDNADFDVIETSSLNDKKNLSHCL